MSDPQLTVGFRPEALLAWLFSRTDPGQGRLQGSTVRSRRLGRTELLDAMSIDVTSTVIVPHWYQATGSPPMHPRGWDGIVPKKVALQSLLDRGTLFLSLNFNGCVMWIFMIAQNNHKRYESTFVGFWTKNVCSCWNKGQLKLPFSQYTREGIFQSDLICNSLGSNLNM